jgi:hypothetical protein
MMPKICYIDKKFSVDSHISSLTDNDSYIFVEERENEHKKKLCYIADNFDKVVELLK